MSLAVRPKFDSLTGPMAELFGGHDRVYGGTARLIPCIGSADVSRDHENRGSETVTSQHRQCVFGDIGKGIVKGQQHRLLWKGSSFATPPQPIGRENAAIAPLVQPEDLTFKSLGSY